MEISRSARNVPIRTGLHPAVYGILAGCVVWMVAMAWLFFAAGAYAALQVAVVAFFAAAFLVTPYLLFRVARGKGEPGSFGEWLDGEIEVADHAMSTRAAMTMILCAPIAGAAGFTAVSFVAWLAASGLI